MDFPLNFDLYAAMLNADMPNQNPHVYGHDELKQLMWLVLKQARGSFCQSAVMGSSIGIHTDDVDLLWESIKYTLEQIRGLTVTKLSVDGEIYTMQVTYMGNINNFEFNINEAY